MEAEKRSKAIPPRFRFQSSVLSGPDITLKDLAGLNDSLRRVLLAKGLVSCFPVQALTWRKSGGGSINESDLCICAPTGSGKTIAYLLPILQVLTQQPNLRCICALIIVPTVDLASQVSNACASLCVSSGIKVGVSLHKTLKLASEHLEHYCVRETAEPSVRRQRLSANEFHGLSMRECFIHAAVNKDASTFVDVCGTRDSNIDILVTPPGRLVSYMRNAAQPLFSRTIFLVIDEADRILCQSYQGWMQQVIASSSSRSSFEAVGERFCALKRLKKVVLSATLSRNSPLSHGLKLHAPHYLNISAERCNSDARFVLPEGLQEHLVLAGGDSKPLVLCALLRRLGKVPVIIFTGSVDVTHRLFVLLTYVGGLPSRPVEYSSTAAHSRRSSALGSFRSGRNQILVASDAASRGLDVDRVGAVISYDIPHHIKTYIHRVGRTARAQQCGLAFTICRPSEVKSFETMLTKVQGHRLLLPVNRLVLRRQELDLYVFHLRIAFVATRLALESAELQNAEKCSHFGNKDNRRTHTIAARVASGEASHNFRL
jgi:ATP-dependent RNA helicase DDX51/DBP6